MKILVNSSDDGGILTVQHPGSGDGVGLWPLSEIDHSNHEVLVPLDACKEGPCYVDGCRLE
jgi:hypothetical protein